MKRVLSFAAVLLAALSLSPLLSASGENSPAPTATVRFASRDTCDLYFDYYAPAFNSGKPTLIYIFGGGFKNGHRSKQGILPWFRELNERGYGVVAIDYRLGLKNRRFSISLDFARAMDNAVGVAVEDLFSATNYLIAHGKELGVDASNLVVSGSSAGAITSLQAEWEICNRGPHASVLPEGFNYRGVISFSGAVFSMHGAVKYDSLPCPQLLFHGTADKIVTYDKMRILGICFAGSSNLAKTLKKMDADYRIYRLVGNSHEIASCEAHFLETELDFLEHNVMASEKVTVDATVTDPRIPIPDWARGNTASLYEN